jgi:hypothetical protein
LKICGDRFENFYTAGYVKIDLFTNLPRYVEVALDDRFLCPGSQGVHRYGAKREKRHDRGGGHEQREAG